MLSGRARRRQWQWYVHGWFYWCCSSRRCVASFGRQAQDAAWIVLLVMMLSRCVPFCCRQARVARHHALLGPFLEVQFLDKLFSPVVVQRQVPDFVQTVRSVARGDSTGAVLGRGLGHYDRCRGPDSANRLEVLQLQVIFKVVDSLIVALRRGPGEIPQLLFSWWSMSLLCWCSRLFVARGNRTGAVLGQFCRARIPQGQFLDKVMVILTGAVVQAVHTVWRCRSCSSSSRTLTSPSWRRGFSMVQTIQLIIEIPPVAVHLVVDVPVVQLLQVPQVQFCGVDVAVFTQRQVPTALCVKTTPQMTHFRDAKVCNKWLQVRIDDHRI